MAILQAEGNLLILVSSQFDSLSSIRHITGMISVRGPGVGEWVGLRFILRDIEITSSFVIASCERVINSSFCCSRGWKSSGLLLLDLNHVCDDFCVCVTGYLTYLSSCTNTLNIKKVHNSNTKLIF